MISILLVMLLSLSKVVANHHGHTNPSQTTVLRIVNYADNPIDIFWMENNSPHHLSRQKDTPLRNSTDREIWSYETHQFLIRYTDHLHTQPAILTKSNVDETYFIRFNQTSNQLYAELEDKYASWKMQLSHSERVCGDLSGNALADCMVQHLSREVNTLTQSMELLTNSMSKVAYRLRNYTCDDDSLSTSKPISTHSYNWKSVSYTVQTLLNMSHAQVWLVEDFITEEECAELERVGRPRLHRATVAAEDGSSVVSENRKAQQAMYDYHQQRGERDPLWDLQKRILDITNLHGGYSLTHEGQEGFTIIQYNPTDQYSQHCDGTCDHSMHTPHGRIATAVMYCQVPKSGGATIFTRANLIVRPKKGAVTFFTYRGRDHRMDAGYTEHSGCPVKEGEKWITTFWMRDGVSLEEPWSQYDPSGLRILDMSQENEL